ncbi:MAG TPA: hypothetical protein VJ826_08340 [Candidatus Polarisedimenticolaceae bacterium]|nr:hypothetical protein [Candidatus Polarisedimenticolaceae bacterium]
MKGYWLVTRDRPGLVAAVLPLLARDARLVLEGDLARCRFPDGLTIARERPDRLVIPLAAGAVRPILDAISPGPLDRDLVRLWVERGHDVLFESSLSDPFPGAFVTADEVNEDFLFRLQVLGVIRTWMGPAEGP